MVLSPVVLVVVGMVLSLVVIVVVFCPLVLMVVGVILSSVVSVVVGMVLRPVILVGLSPVVLVILKRVVILSRRMKRMILMGWLTQKNEFVRQCRQHKLNLISPLRLFPVTFRRKKLYQTS